MVLGEVDVEGAVPVHRAFGLGGAAVAAGEDVELGAGRDVAADQFLLLQGEVVELLRRSRR